MSSSAQAPAPEHRIRQKRGRKTYEALVATGFRLLERQEFEAITVADLAREAGYSVGAFYARFNSKDEFLDALVAHHLDDRKQGRDRVLGEAAPDTMVEDIITELVGYYWKRRLFWRAALLRGMRDTRFWKPLRDYAAQTANALIARISEFAGRELSAEEKMNIKFALQMAHGVVNNSIVNRPGPVLYLGQKRFVDHLSRAFRLVSDYDAVVGR